MTVVLLQPGILFDGATAIVHYETMTAMREGSFADRAESVTREILDANFSAWCDATGKLGGLPDLWIWEPDPSLQSIPFSPEATLRLHLGVQCIVDNCRPAYDWASRPISRSAEHALIWLSKLESG